MFRKIIEYDHGKYMVQSKQFYIELLLLFPEVRISQGVYNLYVFAFSKVVNCDWLGHFVIL